MRPLLDVEIGLGKLVWGSLAAMLVALFLFAAVDVKRQRLLSLLASCALAAVIGASGTVFLVSVLVASDMIM